VLSLGHFLFIKFEIEAFMPWIDVMHIEVPFSSKFLYYHIEGVCNGWLPSIRIEYVTLVVVRALEIAKFVHADVLVIIKSETFESILSFF